MVMLVNSQSLVEARSVETGQNVGDQTLVTKGLTEGEQLIVAGLQKIRPGVPVKIATPQPGAEKQAAPAQQTPAKKAE